MRRHADGYLLKQGGVSGYSQQALGHDSVIGDQPQVLDGTAQRTPCNRFAKNHCQRIDPEGIEIVAGVETRVSAISRVVGSIGKSEPGRKTKKRKKTKKEMEGPVPKKEIPQL